MNKVFVSNPFSELTVTLLLTMIGPLNSDVVVLSGPPSTLIDLANIPSTGVTTLIAGSVRISSPVIVLTGVSKYPCRSYQCRS
jgi:hypothetical protein